MDVKLRAIYIGDVRFDNCPVFELDKDVDEFVMLSDNDFRYEKDVVYEDDDFLVFEITKEMDEDEEIEIVKMVKKN